MAATAATRTARMKTYSELEIYIYIFLIRIELKKYKVIKLNIPS